MFESDDWELDQDFLNDVDDKTIKYCSQVDDQKNEAKRRKIEINNDPIFSPNCDVISWEEKVVNKSIAKQDENKVSRKNLILGIFNKSDKNISQDAPSDPRRLFDNKSTNKTTNHVQSCESTQLTRKNLVLEILKQSNVQTNDVQSNKTNRKLEKNGPRIMSNNYIDAKQKSVVSNDKIKCKASKDHTRIENNSNNDNLRQDVFENSRNQSPCNILKRQSIESKNDSSKCNSPMTKPMQAQSNKKMTMTLVRKFPGPAGLLPDDIDCNIPCIPYLNNLEESEMNEKADANKLPEYCSQNTKNLFTEGAWQLMLDDLPHNFLKGHDIATIKQTATLNGFNSIKVKFLAGIIEHIDYSHDNPPIILKDFTDSIQGIIHRDIPIKYPGLLESNVVILLHDVGLLRISGTFVSNKYQVLISPSNLLAIYTNKGTVEHIRYIESIVGNISDGKRKMEERQKESIFTTALKSHSSETNSQFSEKEDYINKGLTKFNKNLTDANKKNVDKIMEESMDFDSDISFSVSPTGITDSQNQKNFNNVTPMNLKCIIQENKKQSLQQPLVKKNEILQEDDDKERAKNLLKNLKRFSFDANERKYPSHNSTSLQANAKPSTPQYIHSKEVESKVTNDIFSRKIDIDECSVKLSPGKTKLSKDVFRPSHHNNEKKNMSSIRSKLQQFKSADVLTSLENSELDLKEESESFIEKKLPIMSRCVRDKLCDTENDSDDEMLSQLDMDVICSNHNDKN
ncbi:uncharacterized protein LOC143426635 [Xylocopa sonorina]|uniref:uncharacterized protein LOC143426635 n=1 Tax=Xylocopa sonorina TaxID=1818115 RepID=UPI00403A9FAB